MFQNADPNPPKAVADLLLKIQQVNIEWAQAFREQIQRNNNYRTEIADLRRGFDEQRQLIEMLISEVSQLKHTLANITTQLHMEILDAANFVMKKLVDVVEYKAISKKRPFEEVNGEKMIKKKRDIDDM